MRRPLSITFRLALLFSVVAVICFFSVGAYLYQTLSHEMGQRDDGDLVSKMIVIRHQVSKFETVDALLLDQQALLITVFGDQGYSLQVKGPEGRLLLRNREPAQAVPASDVVPADRDPVEEDVKAESPTVGSSRVLRAIALLDNKDGHAIPLTVTLALERSSRTITLAHYAVDLLLAIGLGAVLATAFGYLVIRYSMRPLRSVIGKANDISTHRLSTRLSVQQVPTELIELGSAFNAMLGRLEEGVQRLSGFTADLAHDLRTPITALMVETQVALSRPRSNEEYQVLMSSNLEEYERLSRMIENTLFLARIDNAQMGLNKEPLHIQAELKRISEYFEGLAEDGQIAMEVSAEDLVIDADAILLQRTISNIVSNALRYTPQGGKIRLSAAETNDGVEIRIGNTGPGLPAEHLPHIFERYYRGDSARTASSHSTGLGLAIVRAIMELHGGSVRAQSTPGEWTEFILHFPKPR